MRDYLEAVLWTAFAAAVVGVTVAPLALAIALSPWWLMAYFLIAPAWAIVLDGDLR